MPDKIPKEWVSEASSDEEGNVQDLTNKIRRYRARLETTVVKVEQIRGKINRLERIRSARRRVIDRRGSGESDAVVDKRATESECGEGQ